MNNDMKKQHLFNEAVAYAAMKHAVSREWIKEEIKRLQAEGWFHDFVDVSKL